MTENAPPGLRRIIARIEPGWPQLIDVSSGWYPLLDRLDRKLAAIAPGLRRSAGQIKVRLSELLRSGIRRRLRLQQRVQRSHPRR